jgi:MFS family permease
MVLSVYLPTFLLSFGQGMLIPILPAYAQSFHVSLTLVGLAVAGAGIGTLLADLPAGMWLTRFGRKPVMLAGTGLLAVANLALALAHYFPELVLYRILAGIAGAMWGISRHAFLVDLFPLQQRGRALSVFGGIGRIGAFAGPYVGGQLASHQGFAAPFFFNAAVSLLTLVLAALFIVEFDQPTGKGRVMDWQRLAAIGKAHRRELSAAGAAQIFAQMIRSGRQTLLPLYATVRLGLDLQTLGTIMTVSAAVDMMMFYPAGLIMDRWGRKHASIPCFLVMALGMALLPFCHSAGALLAVAILIGVGNGFGSGTMLTLGADLAPRQGTGEFLGLWRLVGDIGSTGGPLVVGVIADISSLPVSALAMCLIGLLASGTLARFVPETLQPLEAEGEKGQGRQLQAPGG